jgi:two-component system sensor histidine kinase UhpB
MKFAPVAEVKAKFSAYINESQSGPVVITKNGKPTALLLSVTDELQLLRLLLAHAPKFEVDLRLVMASQGLVVALELLEKEIASRSAAPLHLEVDPSIENFLSHTALEVLLSLVIEALANAVKYAQAYNLYLRVYQEGQRVVAEVEDDGLGFDLPKMQAAYPEARSYMDQRASLVNGKISLQSSPGQGTKFRLSLPVK